MELIKKILLSILVVVGVAVAGVIICGGVMVAFPNIKIFGYSYLNTMSSNDKVTLSDSIEAVSTDQTYTINIDVKDFDVNIVPNTTGNVTVTMTNHVFGFTNSLDSNKMASLNVEFDELSNTLNITSTEPNGVFFVSDRVIEIALHHKIVENNQINLVTKTNKGKVVFGQKDSDYKLTFNNITSTCSSYKGNVSFKNATLKGSLNIKNIFGRVEIGEAIQGDVVIDSTVGTYIFKNIKGNLTVKKGTDGDNNPSITADNVVGKIDYYAQNGYLKINDTVFGNFNMEHSNSVNVNINTTIKQVYISNDYGSTYIENLGKLSNSLSQEQLDKLEKLGITLDFSGLSSWSITNDNTDEAVAMKNYVPQLISKDGDITIGTSIFGLYLKSEKGAVTVKQAYQGVTIDHQYGKIDVTFKDQTPLATNGNNQSTNAVNEYINNNLLNFADETKTMLKINTKGSYIKVKNIKSVAEINSQESQMDLNFIKVVGRLENKTESISANQTVIKTSTKQVKLSTPLTDFVLITKQNNGSNAKYNINYGSLQLSSYPTYDQVERFNGAIYNYTEDSYQCSRLLVNGASASSANQITLINTTGAIIAGE